MPETDLSRRSILMSVPAAVLTTSATLPAISHGDPIFAAIEKHRAAYSAWLITCEAADDKNCSDAAKAEHKAAVLASREAEEHLMQTAPTTMGGLLAVIDWLAEYDENCMPDTCGAWLEAFAKSEAFANLKSQGGIHV